ncbi:hypothetical protein [Silicimonas algicola]|uniref:Uncharacterized protein n=1 Tax=Silicimonas algicola TaxID=1826607 RepID=A0A316G2H0_9RHOB|nr:hypothetical protein [Silicimonas algicola]PWK54998.1 hypothetical protein C8D95_10985 [Silicimonas algicola]
MVGYSLTLQDEWAMWSLAAVLYLRLSPEERAFLAKAVLWSMTDEQYQRLLQRMGASQ